MRTGKVLGVILGAAVAVSALPAFAAPSCSFRLGFKSYAQAHTGEVGQCLADEGHRSNGDGIQYTTTGYLLWSQASNAVSFRPKVDGNPFGTAEDPHAAKPSHGTTSQTFNPPPNGCVAYKDGHCVAAW